MQILHFTENPCPTNSPPREHGRPPKQTPQRSLLLAPNPNHAVKKCPVKPPERPNSAIRKNTFNSSALKTVELLRLRKEINCQSFLLPLVNRFSAVICHIKFRQNSREHNGNVATDDWVFAARMSETVPCNVFCKRCKITLGALIFFENLVLCGVGLGSSAKQRSSVRQGVTIMDQHLSMCGSDFCRTSSIIYPSCLLC